MKRWTPQRKATVCQLVLRGDLPRGEAAFLYAIPESELLRWLAAYKARGTAGLYVTEKDHHAI